MATVNKCFKRDLKIIDESYYVVHNPWFNYFEIKKKMNILRTDKEKGRKVKIKNPTLAIFFPWEMNDVALNNLRKRKWVGRQQRGDSYINDIAKRNKEARAKGKLIAQEMQVEGHMRRHNWGRKKIYT